MTEGWHFIWQERELVLRGLMNTVTLLLMAGVMAIGLGIALAVAMMSPKRLVASAAGAYVELFRCAPFLLLLYVIYFGLPSLGLRIGNWWSGLIALVIYNTAYMAVIVQSAWAALPADAIEAGRACGFSQTRLVLRIVLPMIRPRAAPMIGNQLIQLAKDSALLTVIAVAELTYELTRVQATHFIPFAAFITALLLYWVICLAIEFASYRLTKTAAAKAL
jgi:polar amino acid transport system permease protein